MQAVAAMYDVVVGGFGWDIAAFRRTGEGSSLSLRVAGVRGVGNHQAGMPPADAAALLGRVWSAAVRRGVGDGAEFDLRVAYYAHHLVTDPAQGTVTPSS